VDRVGSSKVNKKGKFQREGGVARRKGRISVSTCLFTRTRRRNIHWGCVQDERKRGGGQGSRQSMGGCGGRKKTGGAKRKNRGVSKWNRHPDSGGYWGV